MLLKEKQEIEKWLNKYHIKNYELIEDDTYGYVVNVNGYVDLFNKNLKSINVKFNIIKGWFNCGGNDLTSLIGCPEKINGNFDCSGNKLISLKYGTKIVNGNFDCNNNKLTSLKGCPKKINGYFSCNNNQLISLDGSPLTINGSFYCRNNKLTYKSFVNVQVDIKNNYINVEDNEELGELQNLIDFNKIKKILSIYQEKDDLMKILEVTDKSVEEKLDLLINKDIDNKYLESNDLIKIVEKINKL